MSQVSYVWHFFSNNSTLVTSAANVAPHFILNNLLVFAFIMLWVRSYFWPAEIILMIHVISQSSAYWTHRGSPPFVHWPAIAGPYAWSLTALFWNGAVAVHAHNLPARIVANIFIWVIFLIGFVHIFSAKDYIFGYSLSILTLCKLTCLSSSFYIRYTDWNSPRRQATRHQGHCFPMDLRLCHFRSLLRRLVVRLFRCLYRTRPLAQASCGA